LYSNYKKKGLKFDKKLEFIESIGIFSSKALSKLNTIRNKMEHEYSIPEINELDLYFDLVSAFISNIESAITVLIWDEKNFVKNSENETEYIYFTINLDRKTSPYMIASWRNRKWDTIEEIKISYEDYKLFGFFLKCLYMLNIKNAFASNKYIKLQLTKSYNKLIER
jgi:hypothetical protein